MRIQQEELPYGRLFVLTLAVSEFTKTLTPILKRVSGTQKAFARLCKLDQNQLSQWLSETHRPREESILKMAAALDDADAMALVHAFVKDAVPKGWQKRIGVSVLERGQHS